MHQLTPEQEGLAGQMIAAYFPYKDRKELGPFPLGWLVEPAVGTLPEKRHLVQALPGYGVVCDRVTSNGSAITIAHCFRPGTVWVPLPKERTP